MSYHQEASLLSFTYNCGPNWFGSNVFATLSRCLQQGELEQVPTALLLFVNSGGTSEVGRRRRSKAEAALWCSSPRTAKPQSPGGGGSPSAQGATGRRQPNPLVGMPRFQQRDSAQIAQRDRICFSTSWAMLLEALKRGTLPGANGYDHYLAVVQRYGDTTDANAQLQALAYYGVTARLVQTADFELIEEQIAREIPVACVFIHRSPIDGPTGSGHLLLVIGQPPPIWW